MTKPEYGKLNDRDSKAIIPLLVDCVTYDFNKQDGMKYVSKRLARQITPYTYDYYMRKLEDGVLTDEWLSQFARIGFAQVHQELLTNALNAYRDTIRKIKHMEDFIADPTNKTLYQKHMHHMDLLILKYKELLIQQGNEVQKLSLGTPVISQIKAMVRSELVLQERAKVMENRQILEDENYKILKNILEIDEKKGKLIIQDIQKDISKYDDGLPGFSEANIEPGEISNPSSETANCPIFNNILPGPKSEETGDRTETNDSIRDNTETETVKKELDTRKREFTI